MEVPTTPHAATRRSTRSALAEIPARMGGLTVAENARIPTQTTIAETPGIHGGGFLLATNLTNSEAALISSPEEIVIQQRGRRRLPVTWSPDIDATKRQGCGPVWKDRTPVKLGPRDAGNKSGLVLRSTPRKRLHMGDPVTSPDKNGRKVSPSKKLRTERCNTTFTLQPSTFTNLGCSPKPSTTSSASQLQSTLKGLSQEQLVSVIEDILSRHPYMEQEIIESLPAPDIKPLEEKLSYLKKNIFKSLPNSRLTSKTDSPAYSRASTHLADFKKCVIEQGRCLVESQHWESAVNYALMAWEYVRATPLWDNPPHNLARKQCFKSLTAMAVTALRKGTWTLEQLGHFRHRFVECDVTNDDIEACIKQIDSLINK